MTKEFLIIAAVMGGITWGTVEAMKADLMSYIELPDFEIQASDFDAKFLKVN